MGIRRDVHLIQARCDANPNLCTRFLRFEREEFLFQPLEEGKPFGRDARPGITSLKPAVNAGCLQPHGYRHAVCLFLQLLQGVGKPGTAYVFGRLTHTSHHDRALLSTADHDDGRIGTDLISKGRRIVHLDHGFYRK
jgi:hypothetical protein